jgi:2-phosphoglycerate kinase
MKYFLAMDKIILLGGAPTIGKSYTARKIAESLKLPWISTDTIREQMKKIVSKKDYPSLFIHPDTSAKTAVKFLSSNSADKIVRIQNNESVDVWKGVKALIETDYSWESFIIEGVAILPHLAKGLLTKDKRIKPIFLVSKDIKRIRETIFTRGLWGDADKYPDYVKEKEIEWVVLFNEYIIKEATKYNLPIIEITKDNKYIKKIKEFV